MTCGHINDGDINHLRSQESCWAGASLWMRFTAKFEKYFPALRQVAILCWLTGTTSQHKAERTATTSQHEAVGSGG